MTDMIIHAGELMPALSMADVQARRNTVVEFTRAAMVRDVDYGAIPGTQKPTLLKPGAEKLCTLFGLTPRFECVERVMDWTGADHGDEPLFYFAYKCSLWRLGNLIAEGDGSCNSWEKKYRYREAKRRCPDCGQPTIIKGKREFGGGWLCFKKQGGCGAKFFDGDGEIESQETGQVANPDIADVVNTVTKMAQKRALVGAILIAVNASEFFVADMDDQVVEGQYSVADAPPAAPAKQAHADPEVDQAEAAFWKRFGTVLGYTQWSAVQELLGTKRQAPDSVDGWARASAAVEAALAVEATA